MSVFKSEDTNFIELSETQETKNIGSIQLGKPIDAEILKYNNYTKDIESITNLSYVTSHTSGDYTLTGHKLLHMMEYPDTVVV